MDEMKKGTGDTISSEAAGTFQPSITNNFHGPINVNGAELVSVGGAVANQRNKENEGAPAPSSVIGSGSSNNKVLITGPITAGDGATVNVHLQSPESSSREPSQPIDVDKFDFTKLKTYYSTALCNASPLPWCPEYTWDIDEVYTELALQDSATSKFGVADLFKHAHKHFRKGGSSRILIEGDAGYGKSTLVLKIASDWSKLSIGDSEAYTSSFSLLFVVKLGSVGEDGDILSYMEKGYKKKIKNMDTSLEDVLESEGAEKVLILLDGYDEANAETKEAVGRIMVKEEMMECHVVLTSRFGHVPGDVKGIALLVRVTGFGRRQVAVAVGKFFIKAGHLTKAEVISYLVEAVPPMSDSENESDDSDFDSELNDAIQRSTDDFKSVEEKDPLLPVARRLNLGQFNDFMEKLRAESPYKELARCPLLCVMMCCLVSECPNRELPSTVSGLYFAMINRNLCRADRKKARPAGEVEETINWSELDNRIAEGHENYLQVFGRLCVEGLKSGRMSFTVFDITGERVRAKATDVKVTRLIEAGVLVQDTSEKAPRYQVPHRTTAEFLAAYYLSSETDPNQNLQNQQNLRDLYRQEASFDEVAASLIEMGKSSCLVDAFRDIKFDRDCLNGFMKSYFTRHGAAGTWSEFQDALPNELFADRDTLSTDEPSLTLLQLVEEFHQDNTKTNACRSFKKDCRVTVQVDGYWLNPELLQTLLKSGVGLDRLNFQETMFLNRFHEKHTVHEVGRILQDLLKSHSCPVQLDFISVDKDVILAVTEAMQEVPEGCRLKRFFLSSNWRGYDTSPLEEVLAEKWLSHLQHLGLRRGNPKPILKRLREPGCSLKSLHLSKYKLDIEDLMMLASKLETLSLELMNLDFDVTEISKYAVKERCSLKSLRLEEVLLSLKGSLPSADENQELLLAWRNVALHLEELTINWCEFPIELFSWLNLSLPKLRTLSIGAINRTTPNRDQVYTHHHVLKALTESSGGTIEELSLLRGFLGLAYVLNLHPIREALQRCPRMKSVNLGYFRTKFTSVPFIGPDPSTPLSPSDEEALKSDNNYYALLKIVLSVPKLQTLTSKFFFHNWEEIGTFHVIADKAEKWPRQTNDNGCKTSLTLQGLSKQIACNAMRVFRERGLECRLRYVSDAVYECWFPPGVAT